MSPCLLYPDVIEVEDGLVPLFHRLRLFRDTVSRVGLHQDPASLSILEGLSPVRALRQALGE